MDHPDLARRKQLQQWAGLVAAAGAASLLAPGRLHAQSGGGSQSRRLVAYYSRTGHTRQAALAIARAAPAL